MLAQSPKYTALYDPESGVVFSHGRAEVTEEQAVKLAGRRFMDGILIDGAPAKEWARDRGRDSEPAQGSADANVATDASTASQDAAPLPEPAPNQDTKTARKAR